MSSNYIQEKHVNPNLSLKHRSKQPQSLITLPPRPNNPRREQITVRNSPTKQTNLKHRIHVTHELSQPHKQTPIISDEQRRRLQNKQIIKQIKTKNRLII